MRCLLHIGTEKTGSTTIQAFLHENRDALSALGYLYPRRVGRRSHRKLATAAFRPGRRDNFTRRRGLRTEDQLLAFQARVKEDLRAEIAATPPHELTVFSSELFQSRLTTIEEVECLKAILQHAGFTDFTVLVYLRHPVSLAASQHSTRVKTGDTAPHPPPPDNPLYRVICCHRDTILRFEQVFGAGSVTPRLFEPDAFVGGELITDFLSVLGLSPTAAAFSFPSRENPRLSAWGVEVLRRINRRVPPFVEDDRPNPLRRGLVKGLTPQLTAGTPYQLPPDLALKYEEAFAESNEWVRQRYFPQRPVLFSESPAASAGEEPWTSERLDSVAEGIATQWLELAEERVRAEAAVPGMNPVERLYRKTKTRVYRILARHRS